MSSQTRLADLGMPQEPRSKQELNRNEESVSSRSQFHLDVDSREPHKFDDVLLEEVEASNPAVQVERNHLVVSNRSVGVLAFPSKFELVQSRSHRGGLRKKDRGTILEVKFFLLRSRLSSWELVLRLMDDDSLEARDLLPKFEEKLL